MAATAIEQKPSGRRMIGMVGTAVRVVLGLVLLESVVRGHLTSGFRPAAWLFGLVGLPVLLLLVQWVRVRYSSERMQATGPVGHAINLAILLALYLTPWYAPSFNFASDAALLFYGASMLLAAVRGYAGCEVLAISNWLLRRDDHVGCVVFWPIDALEGHWRASDHRP